MVVYNGSMYKYLFVLSIALLLSSTTSVYADTEVDNRGTSADGRSFVELESESKDSEDEAGTEKLELTCKKSVPEPIIKFTVQVAFPDPTKGGFKVDSLIGTCDADTDKALAEVKMSIPRTPISYFNPFVDAYKIVIGGESPVRELEKTGECKTTDEVLTFWLTDDARGLEIKCGSNNDDEVDAAGGNGGGYTGGGGQYQSQQPPYQQPQQPQYQQSQGYGVGQQQGQDYADWQDQYGSGLQDFGVETDGVFTDNMLKDAGLDDWSSSDKSVVEHRGNRSDGSGQYNPINDGKIYDFNNKGDDGTYYREEELYTDYSHVTEADPISSLLEDAVPAVIDDVYDQWGEIDSKYTGLSALDLAAFDSFKEFKEYYSGEVTEQQWDNWRQQLFTHNRNAANFEFDGGFYNEGGAYNDYAWYNPWGWWVSLNNWITDVSPIVGNGRKYDI